MSNFEALHPRAGGTGPDRTQFAARLHPEPELGLGAAAATLDLPPADYRGARAGQPDTRPAGWAPFGTYESLDHAVQTVTDGPLSRGISRSASREAVSTWHDYAAALPNPDGEQFAAGIRSGVMALYNRQISWVNPDRDRFDLSSGAVPREMDSVLAVYAGTKRTSRTDLEHWRLLLQHAPSDAWQRGHLAAGVVLSGADDYWGMRQNPMQAITGRRDGV